MFILYLAAPMDPLPPQSTGSLLPYYYAASTHRVTDVVVVLCVDTSWGVFKSLKRLTFTTSPAELKKMPFIRGAFVSS